MIEIADVQRGCGTRKKGGTYLDAGMSPDGNLHPGVWLLDYCRTDAPRPQWTIKVAPRAMQCIDPLASVITRSVVAEGSMAGPLPMTDDMNHMAVLGRFGLLDHVGENNYTPWSFWRELMQYGPSRKVPPAFAAGVAAHLPVPIIFTMPLPILGTLAAIETWLTAHADPAIRNTAALTWEPTWENPHWTLLTRLYPGGPRLEDAYYGEDHFMTEVLRLTDAMEPKERTAVWAWVEMPFAVSVITRAVYICQDDEADVPEDLRGTGVVAARLVTGADDGRDDSDDTEEAYQALG